MFPSSSAPRGGCNEVPFGVLIWKQTFQSSSAPRGGCNACIQRRTYLHRSFNPHPPRGAHATLASSAEHTCTEVSILIRPEGRMQRSSPGGYLRSRLVSI